MGYGSILVAYDGSEPSNRALADALDMMDAGLADTTVILSVTDPIKAGDPTFNAAARAAGVLMSVSGDEDAALESLQSQVAGHIDGRGDTVVCKVAFGKPQDAIARTAAECGCGLIVMGSRGLGGVRGMLGSVSTAVLHSSEVPVLVTK